MYPSRSVIFFILLMVAIPAFGQEKEPGPKETLGQLTSRISQESAEAYRNCRYSILSKDYFSRFSRDPEAAPGDREFRLETPLGLTNPLRFQIGILPEIFEHEPYETDASPAPPVDPPVVLNGQIKPGDADRFRFRAELGQELVIDTKARSLIPYLADAVPGWFQAR